MTVNHITPGAMVPSQVQGPADTSSQNVFDYVAQQSRENVQVSNLQELGVKVLNNLDGYFQRATDFAHQAKHLSPVISGEHASEPGNFSPGKPSPGGYGSSGYMTDQTLDKVVQSLNLMFDHAIETQLVVRGTTQVSGVASTLIRGQ